MTADLTFNSANADTSAGGTIPNGTLVSFAGTLGTFANPTSPTANGKAANVYTAGDALGTASLSASLDGQTVSLPVVIRTPPSTRSDFNGDGSADITVYRPSTGQWFIRNQGAVQFGDASDVPVPGDYNGDRTEDVAVFRPSTGQWFVRNQFTVQWGDKGDVPVPGDFNGDGQMDVAVYRPSTGDWFVRNQFTVNFGGAGGYVPVVGDYNGDGTDDVAVFQPSTGTWFIRNQGAAIFGMSGRPAGAG